MWKTEEEFNGKSKGYYFVIRDDTGALFFKSGEWNSQSECRDGMKKFIALLVGGVFDEREVILKKARGFYRQYETTPDEIWGIGTCKPTEDDCRREYALLKENMREYSVAAGTQEGLPLDPKVISFLFSLDGCGYMDWQNNPALKKPWENPQFRFWRNPLIRKRFLPGYFKELEFLQEDVQEEGQKAAQETSSEDGRETAKESDQEASREDDQKTTQESSREKDERAEVDA
ncbi:MAG: hypothetical protein J5898_04010 [Lachnospiraceae bacterium]|nr:hypothetical protein [Lachnospiraceae bacterium]